MSTSLTTDELNAAAPNGYQFEQFLDSGGQGSVFKGQYNGSVVAIKIINPTTTEQKRIDREINFLKTICNPTIVKILAHDQIVLRGNTYRTVTYEFIEQGDLSSRLSSSLPSQIEVMKLGIAISTAIDVIWSARERVVHRDIKPKNIMCRANGDYVLVDFGFARHIDLSDMTVVGSRGTNGYASPEQAAGRKALTFKSDIFSLGITLFLFATGRHPFNGQQPVPGNKVLQDINALRPDLNQHLRDLILLMLHTSAAERPGDIKLQFEQLED